jgi:hypothetical protein
MTRSRIIGCRFERKSEQLLIPVAANPEQDSEKSRGELADLDAIPE